MNNTIVVFEAGGHSVFLEHPTQSGVLDAQDLLGKIGFDGLTYRIEEYLSDVIQLGFNVIPNAMDSYRRDGITHIALLASHGPENSEFFWFGAQRIFNGGVICLYSEGTNEYRYMHCENCCAVAADWAVRMQQEWGMNGVESLGLQEKGQTYH